MTISSKALTTTSLGTSTTKTQLNGAVDVDVPAWATKLLSVSVSLYPLTPKTQISYNAKFMLESDDNPIVPYVALAPPANANIATNTQSFIPYIEEYVVNCPVKGGSKIKAYGQMLLADGTANVYMDMSMKFSDGENLPAAIDPLNGKQRHCQVGTWTAAVAAGKATGTAFTITNCHNIVEVQSIVNSVTTTASKPSAGVFEYTGSAIKRTPLTWIAQPVGAFIGTGIPTLAGLRREQYLNVPLDDPAILTDAFTDVVGLATDYWITAIMWI